MFERDKLRRASIINNSDAHWTEYKIAWSNVKQKLTIIKDILKSIQGTLRNHGKE